MVHGFMTSYSNSFHFITALEYIFTMCRRAKALESMSCIGISIQIKASLSSQTEKLSLFFNISVTVHRMVSCICSSSAAKEHIMPNNHKLFSSKQKKKFLQLLKTNSSVIPTIWMVVQSLHHLVAQLRRYWRNGVPEVASNANKMITKIGFNEV